MDNENQSTVDNNGETNKLDNHGGANLTGNGVAKNTSNEGRSGLSNRSSKMKIGSDGSYHCQFCDKTFPRLGYLKKHEQVCHSIFLYTFLMYSFIRFLNIYF